jgi:hypothetical protein
MKGSDLLADLSCGYVDMAVDRGRDNGPGADRQSDRLAKGPAHEIMPHQRTVTVPARMVEEFHVEQNKVVCDVW